MRYRVIGLDRFSYEYYTKGKYDTLEEAKQAKWEADVGARSLASDTDIQDRYWIEEFE
jgi:hypothetical protein